MMRCALALACGLIAVPGLRADSIDRVMLEQGEELMTAVRGLKVDNVLVVPCGVSVGSQPVRFNVGPANLQLGYRLMNLLVLHNRGRDGGDFALLADTEVDQLVARTAVGTNWTTDSGRENLVRSLANRQRPVLWQHSQRLQPTGFLSATMELSEDARSCRVDVFAFTSTNPKLRRVHSFPSQNGSIPVDGELAASLGRPYRAQPMAWLSPTDPSRPDKIVKVTPRPSGEGPKKVPDDSRAPQSQGPVTLTVLANDQPIEVVAAGGQLRLSRSPKAGERLALKLTNTSDTNRYAVVLAVDGRNTNTTDNESLLNKNAYEQRKWILDPRESHTFPGFYEKTVGDKSDWDIFGVHTDESSAVRFAKHRTHLTGIISLFVYGETPPLWTGSELADLTLQLSARPTALIEGQVNGLQQAKELIRKTVRVVADGARYRADEVVVNERLAGRGLITASGEKAQSSAVVQVKFDLNPRLVASSQLVYDQGAYR